MPRETADPIRPGVAELRDRVRDAILTRELPPGAVRTQVQLAEELGVSRTPLREALRMLELEHLIVRESNGGFRIASLSADETDEVSAMHIALEAAGLRLTIPTLTHADQAELEGLLAQLRRFAHVRDWNGFERPHTAFHEKLTQGVGPAYTEQLRQLRAHATRYQLTHDDPTASDRSYELSMVEHRAILDAAEANDPETAGKLIAVHHARAALGIAAMIAPDAKMRRVRIALAAETGSEDVPAGTA